MRVVLNFVKRVGVAWGESSVSVTGCMWFGCNDFFVRVKNRKKQKPEIFFKKRVRLTVQYYSAAQCVFKCKYFGSKQIKFNAHECHISNVHMCRIACLGRSSVFLIVVVRHIYCAVFYMKK